MNPERIWLVFPVESEVTGIIWAWAGFAATPSQVEGWGPFCPEPALRSWGQVVADRLLAESLARVRCSSRVAPSSSTRPRRAWLLIDNLIRRLCASDLPNRFQLAATRSLREELSAASVAWVPAQQREPTVVGGGAPDLRSDEYRALVPTDRDQSVWFLDHPGPSGPRRVAVIADSEERPTGWLVAFDLPEDRLFDAGDIEVLRSVAVLIQSQRANASLYAELKELLFGIIRALVSAIDAKDKYTAGHSERVARIAVRIADQLELSPNERSDLYLMGLLHDIGKIGIEDRVLNKPDHLTPLEYTQIKAHVRIGVEILSVLKRLDYILPGIAHHHEAYDGSGYPGRLSGAKIPLTARILAVADGFDAMSSDRPYRRRLPAQQIDAILRDGRGRQWDPDVIDALFACRAEIERIQSKGLGDSLVAAVGNVMIRKSERSPEYPRVPNTTDQYSDKDRNSRPRSNGNGNGAYRPTG